MHFDWSFFPEFLVYMIDVTFLNNQSNTRNQYYVTVGYFSLSHNNPCFQCNTAITNFLISNTCEIRFLDVIGQSTVPMYSNAKILKHGRPTWPNEYVLDPYFFQFNSIDSVM